MKKAIVSGSAGFVGSKLVEVLLKNNIEVLALGRKSWEEVDPSRLSKNSKLTYLKIDMSESKFLPEKISEAGWVPGSDCVFYNFAWWGVDKVSDFNLKAQMNNAIWAGDALAACSNLKCNRFIHVGTMEEPIGRAYLDLDYKNDSEYNRHIVYALAKIASRNVIKVLAKKYNIDVIIATNSHVMGPNDGKDSFLQETLIKLKNKKEELIFSTGEQLFDVISVSDCAEAYFLIGKNGFPGSEYRIGSGEARPLKEYVEIMAEMYPSEKKLQFGKFAYNDISLKMQDFSIDLLSEHTGFKPRQTYKDIVKELYQTL
jgi:nucleoside-diphosphate-sugar epimerase